MNSPPLYVSYRRPAEADVIIRDQTKREGREKLIVLPTVTATLDLTFSGDGFRFDDGLVDIFLGITEQPFVADAALRALGPNNSTLRSTKTNPQQCRTRQHLMLAAPYQRFEGSTPDIGGTMNYLFLKPDWLNSIARDICGLDRVSLALCTDFRFTDNVLEGWARRVIHSLRRPNEGQLLQECLLHVLGAQLLGRHTLYLPTKRVRANPIPEQSFARVTDYIDAHLGTSMGLTELAQIARLSDHHFLRSFKLATGITPYRYVVGRRIERAEMLLKRTRQPLAQIAADTGFASQSHMTHTFKANRGITPLEYRLQA